MNIHKEREQLMSDYKNTLNLPQTDFPMKANLPQREGEILKKWQTLHLYQKERQEGHRKPKFILHSGPPYANGHIHLGHAINMILKDMIVKFKTLSGFDAAFIPGWDCHGLPIELNVEKKIGKPGQKVSAEDFRLACREYAASFVNIQREEFKRLGIIADWEHPYLTMDFKYEANIIRSLAKIIDKHHLEKGYKPVHWCLDCASALAEAEVEYSEKTSPSIDVRFKVIDQTLFEKRFDELTPGLSSIFIPIWTTTPWTLPANQAVALNPKLEYVLVECDEREQFLIAEALLDSVLKRYEIKNHRIRGKIIGEKLQGILLQHPFYERKVPVVLGEHVTVDSGTGAVHTAPAHGQEDYLMAKQYHLPIENPVGNDGCFIESTPLFAGIHVNKANDQIIAELIARNTLIHQEKITHSYPHCWRHKTALIFRATPQWFISMDKNGLREKSLAAIEKVEWIPDWGKLRIKNMIEGRPDWCISRQRAWGVPLALFIHKETGELHPNTKALMEKVAQQVEEKGIEAWYTCDSEALLGNDAKNYEKIFDTLDVWFDSGVSHECVLKTRPELTFPADIVLEGSDQHRGWFQSSLLSSIAINDEASYHEVLTHGFVVDGQGRKMSKSIGNVIAPEEVIKTLGADILRLWVASIDYRYEIAASKEILSRTSEAYRRIRNTTRFLLANLHDFNPEQDLIPIKEMLKLDQWAIDQAAHIQKDIIEAYETYQFHIVIQKLHQFCVTDMGGFYLDIIKDRQYTMAKNSLGRRSAQSALFYILHAFVRWLAPVLSFTAEEVWQYIPGKKSESVLLSQWSQDLIPIPEQEKMNQSFWEKIRSVRDAVNKVIEQKRSENLLGSTLEAEVYLYCQPSLKKELELLQNELKFILLCSFAQVHPETEQPSEAIQTDVPGLSLKVVATSALKCERCWHRTKDVNTNSSFPNLCSRCIGNISGEGEARYYA